LELSLRAREWLKGNSANVCRELLGWLVGTATATTTKIRTRTFARHGKSGQNFLLTTAAAFKSPNTCAQAAKAFTKLYPAPTSIGDGTA
jgi:hypothetical protein